MLGGEITAVVAVRHHQQGADPAVDHRPRQLGFAGGVVVGGTVAPAIAPLFLAVGGGQNYAALYLSAAGFAIVGAIAAQFIRAVR